MGRSRLRQTMGDGWHREPPGKLDGEFGPATARRARLTVLGPALSCGGHHAAAALPSRISLPSSDVTPGACPASRCMPRTVPQRTGSPRAALRSTPSSNHLPCSETGSRFAKRFSRSCQSSASVQRWN